MRRERGASGGVLLYWQKTSAPLGMILLTEYHASFIRLRRVILLRSGIRLTPSGIRYASFMANKISLKPQGFNITIAIAIISLRRSRNTTRAFSANLCYNENDTCRAGACARRNESFCFRRRRHQGTALQRGMGFARCICNTNAKLAK